MAWTLDSDRPIYIQLVEQIQLQIVSGCYQPGQKLPSVRDLAAEASVNPNTMQKAFGELECSGLVITQSTSGRTVTEDGKLIQNIRRKMAGKLAETFFSGMKELGYTEEEVLSLFESGDLSGSRDETERNMEGYGREKG